MSGITSYNSPLLYKYVTINRLKQILQGTVRFTQPSAFNDPFELLPEIITPYNEKEKDIKISIDIHATCLSKSMTEQSDLIPEGCYSNDATSRNIVRRLNQIIGILCLSKSKDSLLMWSHYADQFAGAVIGFDSNHNFFTGKFDIGYSPKRPKIHLQRIVAGTPISIADICIKSSQWEYEKEVRIVRKLTDCKQSEQSDSRGFPIYIKQIPLGAIKSVILGERTPIKEQREIFSFLRETHISLSLAAIDHSGFLFREEIVKFSRPASQIGGIILSPRTANIFSDHPNQLGQFARFLLKEHPMSKIVNKPI